MGSYTITFTPDDASNASAVVRVDLGVAGARITELTVRAGNGDGLVPGELPGFDLGRLMRAIAPAGPTAPAFELSATPTLEPAAIATYPAQAAATTVTTPARKTGKRTPAKRAAAKQAPAKQTAAKKAAAAKATAGTGRGRKAAGSGAAARSGGAAARATKRTGATAARTTGRTQGAGRAYRRTPDDIVEVFNQAPSATTLARHYGVPRHTVQGWLRRLRSEGLLPPSSRSAA